MKRIAAPCLVLLLLALTPSLSRAGVANLSLIPYPLTLGNYLYVPEGDLGGVGYAQATATIDSDPESNQADELSGTILAIGYDMDKEDSLVSFGYGSSSSTSSSTRSYETQSYGGTYQVDEKIDSTFTSSTINALFANNISENNWIYFGLQSNRQALNFEWESTTSSNGTVVDSSSFNFDASNSWISPLIGFTAKGDHLRFGVKLKPATSVSSKTSYGGEFKSGNGQQLTLGIGLQEENYQIELDRIQWDANESSSSSGQMGWDLNGQYLITKDSLLEGSLANAEWSDYDGNLYSKNQTLSLSGIINFGTYSLAVGALQQIGNSENSSTKQTTSIWILSLAGSF